MDSGLTKKEMKKKEKRLIRYSSLLIDWNLKFDVCLCKNFKDFGDNKSNNKKNKKEEEENKKKHTNDFNFGFREPCDCVRDVI